VFILPMFHTDLGSCHCVGKQYSARVKRRLFEEADEMLRYPAIGLIQRSITSARLVSNQYIAASAGDVVLRG
jgi:hypothetical protein